MPLPVSYTAPKPTDSIGLLDKACALMVMSERISQTLEAPGTTEYVKCRKSELLSMGKVTTLAAHTIDDLIYTVERQAERIKVLESMVEILKQKS